MTDRDTDQLLVERVQRGDKQAFGLLVVKHQRKLARMLSRIIRDAADVEDVVQESFIRAYRALPGFRNDSAFYTWLYRIGVNTAKSWLASNQSRLSSTSAVEIEDLENHELDQATHDCASPEALLMSKQIAATVNAAVAELPEDMRTAVTLREIDGLSYEEIADAMNSPVGTVRSRIFRAREAIATKLRPIVTGGTNKRW
jgi:RNA polymerase sigma-70 factor, ECF subfamily